MATAAPIRFSVALGLSLSVGCLSLSYEIVWFRIFSFQTGSSALAFALVLGAFLFGIAVGSTGGWLLSQRVADYRKLLRALALLIVASSLLGFFFFPAAAFLNSSGLSQYVFVPIILVLVALGAALMGAVFPLLGHLAVLPDERAGLRLSYLYLANILGSVTGSLGTGFVLMEYLGIAAIADILVIAGLALGLVVLLSSWRPSTPMHRWGVVAAAGSAMFIIPLVTRPLFADGYERLLYHAKFGTEPRVVDTIENKHGVINVTSDNVVYGGGMYDGRAVVSLTDDVNILERPFSLSLIHPNPREILMIGLGSGSWVQVLANHPQLEKLTVLEINSGYLSLIAKHPEVASALRNPKVRIVIDDARRWLSRASDEKFDAIVQNTTFYFRANTTNLLSEEYLRLLLAHLKPGGVAMYNTVWSDRAQRTACIVPPYGLRLQSMMAIANEAPAIDRDRWERVLLAYHIDGQPVLDLANPQHVKRFGELKADLVMPPSDKQAPPAFLETCDSILQRTAGLRTMTDDNMGEEWNFIKATRVFANTVRR